MKYSSPRGTTDIFGEDINYRNHILDVSDDLFYIYNYHKIITPTFEKTDVFSRGIGQETDIVQKEMYTFNDKKDRSLTLRPEGTASVVRALIENNMISTTNIPLKLFYSGNMFRYERPQKGMMREFYQIGVESFGIADPLIDAETIWLLKSLFSRIGFKKLKLKINSLGCSKCRKKYLKIFREEVEKNKDGLCGDCRIRLETNPLRLFDCKKENCRKILKTAPKISDYLCEKCSEHFNTIIKYLEVLDIEFEHDTGLVRGFDYYTRTIFEIISDELDSAQNALGGGGRYDELVEQFGGPKTPAIGFAIGVDRTILLMKELGINYKTRDRSNSVFIINMVENNISYALEILKFLRDEKIKCDISYASRNIGSMIKKAEGKNYDYVIIIGEEEISNKEITIKDLKKFKQEKYKIDKRKEILEFIRSTG